MKIHSLNCGTLCPPCRRAVNGTGGYRDAGTLICHCLLLETASDGLVLIDTGLGTADCEDPQGRLGGSFLRSSKPLLRLEETALQQVRAIGFSAQDVRHILLTHLDLDHAGGLSDFPSATVHLLSDEKASAEARSNLLARERYRPEQWKHVKRWETYSSASGEKWKGLENVQRLREVQSEVLLVPLLGHTLGHAGYAIDRGDDAFLHCGDAYFHAATVSSNREVPAHGVPWGLALFQQLVAMDRKKMNETQRRLREFATREAHSTHVFSAHDPKEKATIDFLLNP